jgi:hypothetical protein
MEGKNMATTRRKTAKAKMHPHVKSLTRAGLLKARQLTDAARKKIAKLSKAEVRAMVSAKRKLRFRGSMHGSGDDIF